MRLLQQIIVKHSVLVIVIIVALTIPLSVGLQQPRYDVSVESFLTEEDISLYRYRDYTRDFGNDDELIVLYRVDNPYSDDVLSMLQRTGMRIRNLPFSAQVYSLADAVSSQESGGIPLVTPLVTKLPLNETERLELINTVRSKSAYWGKVVSESETVTGLSVQLKAPETNGKPHQEIILEKSRYLDNLIAIVTEEARETEFSLAGWPYIKHQMNRSILSDLSFIAPSVILVSMFFLWAGFRSFYFLIIGMANLMLILVWTLSIFFLLGRTLNLVSAMLPTLVMAISFAQIIFIFSQYRRTSGAATDRLTETINKAIPPCFLGAITTAAGFLSLTATNIGPIQEFGLFSAIGIITAFVINALLIPAMLKLRPHTRSVTAGKTGKAMLSSISKISHRKALIMTISLAIIVGSAFGFNRIHTTTSMESFFPPDHAVSEGMTGLHDLFGGVNAIDFIAERKDGRQFDQTSLSELQALRASIMKRESLVTFISVLDIGQLVWGSEESFKSALGNSDGPAGNRPVISTIFASQPAFSRHLTPDLKTARFAILSQNSAAEHSLEVAAETIKRGKVVAPSLKITATGQSVMLAGMSRRLLNGQVISVLLILLFVTIVISIANRSLVIGIISLVPNVIPILLMLGFMGLTGIPLNVVTIMVSSIAIGIAVDDTIHFVHYLRRRIAEGLQFESAIDETILAKGRPIIFTSLLLTATFLTHMISSFQPTIYLGLLSAIAMISALLGDLFLLPALIRIVRPKSLYTAESRQVSRSNDTIGAHTSQAHD